MIIWGFGYFGNGARRDRMGACRSCGRTARLESRTARWWFTLYFIPVIPGRRWRLVDMCVACSRGAVLAVPEFEKTALETTAPLLERFRGGDVPAGLERARRLVELGLYSDARRQAQDAVARGGPPGAEAQAVLDEAARLESAEEARGAGIRRTLGFIVFAVMATVALLVLRGGMSVRVLVDNPTARPIQLALDGEPWLTLAPRSHERVSLSRGRYAVTATAGSTTEAFELEVDPGFRAALLDDPAYFVDPLRLGVYDEYDATYGTAKAEREEVSHVALRCFRADRVKCALSDPPARVKGNARYHVVLRETDATARGVAVWLMNNNRGAEAVDFFERAVDAGGAAPTADDLGVLGRIAALEGRAEEVSAWIAARRADPPAGLPFHLAAQRAALDDGRGAEVREEYARLLEEHPQSADHLFLAGRVAASCGEAVALFERALERAPGRLDLVGARVAALSYGGREDDAVRAALDAAEAATRADHEEMRDILVATYARAGQPERARGLVEHRPAKERKDDDGAADDAFLSARLAVRAGVADAAWQRALEPLATGHTANESYALRLAVERARQGLDAAGMTATAEALSKRGGGDAAFVAATQVLAEAARGDAGAAESRLEAHWSGSPPGRRPLRMALRYAVFAAWMGAAERADAWSARVLSEATGPSAAIARSVAAYLAGPRPLGPTPVTGEEYLIDDDARGLVLMARALRAASAAERDRLLERAERAQGADFTESASWARLLRARGEPARR